MNQRPLEKEGCHHGYGASERPRMRIKNLGSEVRHPERNAVASIFVVEGGQVPCRLHLCGFPHQVQGLGDVLRVNQRRPTARALPPSNEEVIVIINDCGLSLDVAQHTRWVDHPTVSSTLGNPHCASFSFMVKPAFNHLPKNLYDPYSPRRPRHWPARSRWGPFIAVAPRAGYQRHSE
jgi:hypothetical protein